MVIRLPDTINTENLQELIDYLCYEEATSKSRAKQADVDALVNEVKGDW